MSLSMYQISVPVFVRALGVLSALLEKGSAHVKAEGKDPDSLVSARLAPDMLPLSGQVQRASDTSKLAVERLTGIQSPRFDDKETTMVELQDRIAKTAAFLKSIDAAAMDGSEERTVNLSVGTFKQAFRGDAYLLTFALPNFFFHITTAYAILRHHGVKVGKADYIGKFD